MELKGKSCEVCAKGADPLSTIDINAFLDAIPGWQVKQVNEISQLWRSYEFADFAEALAYTNSVGFIAEQENHHPELITEWGRVTVKWWTHSVQGLHINDFIMAAKCDNLAISGS